MPAPTSTSIVKGKQNSPKAVLTFSLLVNDHHLTPASVASENESSTA